MLTNVVRSAVQNIPRTAIRPYSIYGPANYKQPSIDDMPVPYGSWQEAYKRKQARYNMQLIGGIIFTVVTIAFAKTTGCLYLNWDAPVPKNKD